MPSIDIEPDSPVVSIAEDELTLEKPEEVTSLKQKRPAAASKVSYRRELKEASLSPTCPHISPEMPRFYGLVSTFI